MDLLLAPIEGADRHEIGGVTVDVVRAANGRVKRLVYPPGFRWSKHLKPLVGTMFCMHAHVGFLARGHVRGEYADGCAFEFVAPQVVVPGTSVYYAPDVSANVFFYQGRYHTVANGVWSTAPAACGAWVVIQMGKVPAPVLSVLVEYYKILPGHLKKAGPPPWAGPKKPKDK